jgi:hypothetical protein
VNQPSLQDVVACESSVERGADLKDPTLGTTGDGTGGSFSVSPIAVLCRFDCQLLVALGNSGLCFLRVAVLAVAAVEAKLTVVAVESARAGLSTAS